MASSEKQSSVTGRQYVAGAKVPVDFSDFNAGTTYLATDLPEGAVVTGGWFMVDVALLPALITLGVTVVDSADVTLDTLAAGLDVDDTGKEDLVLTGVEMSAAGEVKLTTSAAPTAGSGYLYLEYVVDGRSHFSEG